jgi:hypothetical protein
MAIGKASHHAQPEPDDEAVIRLRRFQRAVEAGGIHAGRIVGPVLVILALVLMTEAARAFFVAMGVIIFAVERLTAYRSTTAAK